MSHTSLFFDLTVLNVSLSACSCSVGFLLIDGCPLERIPLTCLHLSAKNEKERMKKRLTSKKLAEFLRVPQALNITRQRQCTDPYSTSELG